MNTKHDGPFVAHFESDVTGIVRQELVTYRIKNGMLTKEVTVRTFSKDKTDWLDTSSSIPLTEATQ